MPRPWQRIAACAAAALLTLLLCGCEVHGTVDVKSGTQAEANLIFTDAEVDCLGLTKYAGLVIKGTPESDGNQTCRAQGTIELDSLKDFGIELSQTGEYLLLDLAMPQQYDYMATKVDITFPGKVLEGGRTTVSGNSVQLNERSLSTTPGSSRVIALSHTGPEWWVLALIAGFGGGVALTVVVVLLLRRHRHLRETLQVDADELPPDATSPATGASPETGARHGTGASPETGARPPTNPPPPPDAGRRQPITDADYAALFAPPKPGAPATPTRPLAPLRPPPEAAASSDHEIWAPPEDQRDR